MEPHFKVWALRVWAVAGVPVFFGTYVLGEYRYALSHGQLPLSIFPEWLWFIVFGLCVVSGVVALNLLPFRQLWVRITTNIIYVPVIVVSLLYVHLFVVCANGDCL